MCAVAGFRVQDCDQEVFERLIEAIRNRDWTLDEDQTLYNTVDRCGWVAIHGWTSYCTCVIRTHPVIRYQWQALLQWLILTAPPVVEYCPDLSLLDETAWTAISHPDEIVTNEDEWPGSGSPRWVTLQKGPPDDTIH